METIAYKGWPNCTRLTNGSIELIITGDVGPRIIRFGFTGDVNEFAEFDEHAGLTGGDAWRLYGGHRLWHAPESVPRTYQPDNAPVQIADHGDFVRVTPPTEALTGIQKEMDVYLHPNENRVRIVHRLHNRGLWPVELAPWAISMLAPGGTAIIPLPPRGPHPQNLLPTATLALWPYTHMNDPRWDWGERYILLRQDEGPPQKIGTLTSEGWLAYWRGGHLFAKFYEPHPGPYPDMNSQAEVYTDARILELETLGPLAQIPPGGCVEHVESWLLLRDIAQPTQENVEALVSGITPWVE